MKRILVSLAAALSLWAFAGIHASARAPFSLVADVATITSDTNSVTSGAIDTRPANLIVVGMLWYNVVPTLLDSELNTWTALTASVSTNVKTRIFYCSPCTTAAAHTFTLTGAGSYPVVSVLAFSGAASSPFDAENGNANGMATSITIGSVTPSEDNEVLVAFVSGATGDITAIDSGFTLLHHGPNGGVSGGNVSYGSGYQIQTSATARGPKFDSADTQQLAAAMATFKTTAGSTAIPPFNNPIRGGGWRR